MKSSLLVKLFLALIISPLMVVLFQGYSLAYNLGTHRSITIQSIKTVETNLDLYLKSNLGISFSTGFTDIGSNQTKNAADWISTGSVFEDGESILEFTRPRKHFHNPLTNIGLSDTFSGVSAVNWAISDPGNKWSWAEARDYFYEALTAQTESERNDRFSKMFRALGQVVHLIQDMSVPAHVRNDNHVIMSTLSGFNSKFDFFESIVEQTVNPLGFSATPFSFGPNFPLSVFWDGETYRDLPTLQSGLTGLSEYTSYNFFSEDTIFTEDLPKTDKHYFPHPRKEFTNAALKEELAEDNDTDRLYYVQGYETVRLAAYSYFHRPLADAGLLGYVPSGWTYHLDESVIMNNANILIPKAISYSAGLLNYFFRGNMEARFDSTGLKITNKSTENMNGTFALYYDATDGKRYPVQGARWPLSLAVGAISLPQSFSGPTDPAPKDRGKYTLVFRGALGAESDAVVAKTVQAHYVFIIQESAELKSVPIEEQHISGPGYDRQIKDKHWKGCPQTVTGHFIVYGSIQRISLIPRPASEGGPYEGVDQLFINEQSVDNNTWVGDSGADKPTSWQVERSCIDPEAYPPMQLEVQLANGDIFIQYLVVYGFALESVAYEPAGSLQPLYPYTQFRSSAIELSTYFHLPTASVPGIGELKGIEQFELVQLNNHTPDETFEGIIGGKSYILSVSLTPLYGRPDYYEHSTEGSSVGTFPDPYVVTLTGQLDRIYSEKELDSLKAMGIQAEDYSILLQ